jgi:ubiquinone/menaquinone biosynthesis C-methylase UbiE
VRLRRSRSKNWDEHVDDLEQMASSGAFQALRDRILELARLRANDHLLDVGAGTGLLALAAAPHVARVSALDVSPAMCDHLRAKLDRAGVSNVEVLVDTATDLPLADGTFDVVLSNYCFHHLTDAEKRRALLEIGRVLRPGGRLVFADMMFRVTVTSQRDRAVIALLVKRMLRRGPAGLVRLCRNAARVLTRSWEHPASVDWWRDALLGAGFAEVTVRALEHEGGIAFARRPG